MDLHTGRCSRGKIRAIPGAICMTNGAETSKGTDGTAEWPNFKLTILKPSISSQHRPPQGFWTNERETAVVRMNDLGRQKRGWRWERHIGGSGGTLDERKQRWEIGRWPWEWGRKNMCERHCHLHLSTEPSFQLPGLWIPLNAVKSRLLHLSRHRFHWSQK